MKRILTSGLLILMVALSGCPAHTDEPIDNGSYDVPGWLTGGWSELDYKGEKKKGSYVLEKGSKKGQMKCYEIDSLGMKKLAYDPVILSKVSDKVFMSLYSPGNGYYLFELKKVSDTEFSLTEIDEEVNDYDLLPETKSADIRKYLETNKNNESIYGLNTRYKK